MRHLLQINKGTGKEKLESEDFKHFTDLITKAKSSGRSGILELTRSFVTLNDNTQDNIQFSRTQGEKGKMCHILNTEKEGPA
ncbi:hypothetical protein WN943_020720 [Citrus x changshan-huyou]